MKVSTNFGTVKIVMLKGEKGDKFQFEDYTPEELESLRGEQGEPFTYDDFTEAQLEDLRSEVASAYYRKVDATYYTIGDNTETIAIPIEGYTDSDMLFIDIEGLALAEGVDYTIEGSNIVLTEPITHNYTAVNFRALRAFAITTEDYDSLIGDLTTDLGSYVDEWLAEHPEATTTVQDGSVTNAKLAQTGGVLSEVEDIRTGYDGTVYASAGDAVRGQVGDIEEDVSDFEDWTGYPRNLFNARSFTTTNAVNWGITATRTSVEIVHKTQWSTGYPIAQLTLLAGDYIFHGDFSLSSLKDFGLWKDGASYKSLKNGTEFTVESGSSYNLVFAPAAQQTFTITDISIVSKTQNGKIQEIESELDNIPAFDYEYVNIELTAETEGYISKTGDVAGTGAAPRHVSFSTADYIGKELKLSGVSWYEMMPWVFVGTDGKIEYPNISSASSIVVHEDMLYTPKTAGTIYLNYMNSPAVSTVHRAMTRVLSTVDSSAILKADAVSRFVKLSFNIITGKILNWHSGYIEDSSSDNVVTDYIPVTPLNKYMITTQNYWSNALYVFYDENHNFISSEASASGGTHTQLWGKVVLAPATAAYLVVAMHVTSNFPSITVYEGARTPHEPFEKWKGIKWVCVGDSLTERNVKKAVGYYDIVSAITGIEPYIMGVSGTGYARGNDSFRTRALTIPSDADVITIFGSFNDLSSGLPIGTVTDIGTDTIAGCINETINNVYSVNPVANLGIIAPCPWGTTQPSDSGAAYNYVSMLEAICKRRSIPFLDLWHCSGLAPWVSSFAAIAYPADDAVHPNDVGHGILAPKFKAFLETLLM